MPIENDILALVQESSKDPNGFTPETAAKVVTRLKQFHSEKKAKAEQRKAQGINSPDEDSDLADYDSKLNDPEYVKEFLPQLLYEESQRVRTPQAALTAPTIQLGAGLPTPPGEGESREFLDETGSSIADTAKWGAEVAANTLPAFVGGPAGLAAKVAMLAIPNAFTLNRLRKGGSPQDFSTSLAQAATGAAVNKVAGPAAEWIRSTGGKLPLIGNTLGANGGYNAADLLTAVGAAEANMLLPSFVNDTSGFEIPEGTDKRAGLAALLGALPMLGKQWYGAGVANSGTRTLEDMQAATGRAPGAVNSYGAPTLAGPKLIPEVSERTAREVGKIIRDPEVTRALTRQKPPAPPSPLPPGMSIVGPNGQPVGSAAPPPNPPIPQYARDAAKLVRPFTKGAKTSTALVRDRVTNALDGLFSYTEEGPANRAADNFADIGSRLKELHNGDTQAAKDSVMGYFFHKFYRNPAKGDGIDGAQEALNSVSNGERLEKMFKEMGLSTRETADTIAKLWKTAKAMDKISRIDEMASTQQAPSIRGLRMSDPGFTAWWNPQHWIERAKPTAVAESVLRGKNPLLPSSMQKGMAKWLRRIEDTPNKERGLSTMLEQMAAANWRDPDKR